MFMHISFCMFVVLSIFTEGIVPCVNNRDVGSISNVGGARRFKGLKKYGAFSKTERALPCLLQNLGGHVPPVPPVPTSMVYNV